MPVHDNLEESSIGDIALSIRQTIEKEMSPTSLQKHLQFIDKCGKHMSQSKLTFFNTTQWSAFGLLDKSMDFATGKPFDVIAPIDSFPNYGIMLPGMNGLGLRYVWAKNKPFSLTDYCMSHQDVDHTFITTCTQI